MPKIKIKNIESTCLKADALKEVIVKFYSSEKDLEIVFDKRIKDSYGWYFYDEARHVNLIRVSPLLHQFHDCDVRKPITAETQKYTYISTILHELRHAQQRDEWGKSFYSKEYCRNKNLIDSYAAYHFTEIEIDACIYELQHVLEAVKIYNSCET